MKIGLLTYHISTNNGAMLQTYATCRALSQLGHDVKIIDIRQPEIIHTNLIVRLIVGIIYAKREYNTKIFRKKFYAPLTQHYSSIEDLRNNPPEVDCLVVGSDQTWNPNIAGTVLPAYFLDFGGDHIRRISYASSFGLNQWPMDNSLTEMVKASLDRFKYLSSREDTGVKILKETFNLKANKVLDPTMLFEEYYDLVGNITKENNEIVCYKLHRDKDFFDNIGRVKALSGLPIRLLNNSFPVKGLKYTYPPSVAKWVRLIAESKYVITDSFHGCVFSLLYKKSFAVILSHNGKDSRMLDLLKELGLENRAYDSTEMLSHDSSWMQTIDYSKVDKIIDKLRSESWDYLIQALK